MADLVARFPEQVVEIVTLLLYAYGLLLVTWPLFLWLERLMPVQAETSRSNLLFNWKIIGSNLLLTPLFQALAVLVGQLVAHAVGGPALPYPAPTWTVGVPLLDGIGHGILLFLGAVVLGDAWYYWWHRMQHEWPALWELHKLHHSDEFLNATTIFRSHFLELAGQALVRGLTIGLVFDLAGLPQTALAIVVAGLLPPVWDIFIHANVRIDWMRPLLPFLSTPQFHWIHHSREPQHQDKNYSIWIPFFDVLFGTYYAPRVDEYPPTGLSSGETIETLWDAQAGPLLAWSRRLQRDRAGEPAK